jgi:hypothetical protein
MNKIESAKPNPAAKSAKSNPRTITSGAAKFIDCPEIYTTMVKGIKLIKKLTNADSDAAKANIFGATATLVKILLFTAIEFAEFSKP